MTARKDMWPLDLVYGYLGTFAKRSSRGSFDFGLSRKVVDRPLGNRVSPADVQRPDCPPLWRSCRTIVKEVKLCTKWKFGQEVKSVNAWHNGLAKRVRYPPCTLPPGRLENVKLGTQVSASGASKQARRSDEILANERNIVEDRCKAR